MSVSFGGVHPNNRSSKLASPDDLVERPLDRFVDRVWRPCWANTDSKGLVVKYQVFPHRKQVQLSPDRARRGNRIVRPQSQRPEV